MRGGRETIEPRPVRPRLDARGCERGRVFSCPRHGRRLGTHPRRTRHDDCPPDRSVLGVCRAGDRACPGTGRTRASRHVPFAPHAGRDPAAADHRRAVGDRESRPGRPARPMGGARRCRCRAARWPGGGDGRTTAHHRRLRQPARRSQLSPRLRPAHRPLGGARACAPRRQPHRRGDARRDHLRARRHAGTEPHAPRRGVRLRRTHGSLARDRAAAAPARCRRRGRARRQDPPHRRRGRGCRSRLGRLA